MVRRREELKGLRQAAVGELERRLDDAHRQLDDAQGSLALKLPGPLRGALEWARRRKDDK